MNKYKMISKTFKTARGLSFVQGQTYWGERHPKLIGSSIKLYHKGKSGDYGCLWSYDVELSKGLRELEL